MKNFTKLYPFFLLLDSKKNWSFSEYRVLESDYMHTYNIQTWSDAGFWQLSPNVYSCNYSVGFIPHYEKIHRFD